MEPEHMILAEVEGLGRVYSCANCKHIHLQLGAMSLTLTTAAYIQLVAMVNTSAANYEQQLAWDEDGQGLRS